MYCYDGRTQVLEVLCALFCFFVIDLGREENHKCMISGIYHSWNMLENMNKH